MTAATAPEPPAAAGPVFGTALPSVRRYADLLAGPGIARGLLGPRERDQLWERHLLNCGVVAPLLPPSAAVVDVGSGAGLPGIVLALARPDVAVTLVEPLLRRTTFLAECVDALGLARVHVVRGRAEEVAGRLSADVVVSRAVAPLERLLGWCWPLVRDGGQLLAMKGARAAEEIAAATPALRRSAGEPAELLLLGSDLLPAPVRVVRVRRQRPRATGQAHRSELEAVGEVLRGSP